MPLVVRYRGLLLALIVAFAILTVLGITTSILLGKWALAVAATVTLVASMVLYEAVKDYE